MSQITLQPFEFYALTCDVPAQQSVHKRSCLDAVHIGYARSIAEPFLSPNVTLLVAHLVAAKCSGDAGDDRCGEDPPGGNQGAGEPLGCSCGGEGGPEAEGADGDEQVEGVGEGG